MRFRALVPFLPLLFGLAVGASFVSGFAAPRTSTVESATGAAPAGPAVPLEQLVRPDGTLDLTSGYRGSVSTAGWRMAQGADGAPRFARESSELGEAAVSPSNAAQATSDPADINWDDRFAWVTGTNAVVRALTVDGSGNLYVAGDFTTAGGSPANRIAKWDGTAWSALGSGLNNIVYALAVDGSGNVYAGGSFSMAGGTTANRIAKWNGTSWSALGSGMNSSVYALAVDGGGGVCAGGDFTTAGGVSASCIAKWNGTSWSALGSGMGGTLPSVYALAVDGGGNLYAGGYFTSAGSTSANHIAKWDGTTWLALGTGAGAFVRTLTMDAGGDLYVAGDFTTVGGAPANHIAKWNGTTWSSLGTGMTSNVYALATDGGGNLYAGGAFFTAGGSTANRIARWDGTSWSALGSGANSNVRALAVDGSGSLYAGGDFLRAGGLSARGIAKWDGSSWSRLHTVLGLGIDYWVTALAVAPSGNVYAGGEFSLAGGAETSRIAKWNGAVWSALGSGVGGTVLALALDGSEDLYVGGGFLVAGGSSANRIAKWDGTGWSALGSGVNNSVRALAVDGMGNLYAGGDFTIAGGGSANYVAKWDGTYWLALGTGTDGSVRALAIDASGNLYAGGAFVTAGGVAASRIAKWDGVAWSALGSGVNGAVQALVVDHAGNVYAGGQFSAAGGGGAGFVAKWNGSAWSALGGGVNAFVSALAVDTADILYAGGYFTIAGGAGASSIASWNGAGWSALGSGVNSSVWALAVDDQGNRFVGGEFDLAGGKPSSGFGIWHVAPSFADIAAALPAVQEGSTAWGDYDGDGDLDLVLTGYYGAAYLSRIYRNQGAGAFTDIGAGLPGVAYSSVAWGDYDNDGDLDLALTGYNGGGYLSRIYRSDGGGAFADIGAGLPGVIYGSVAWGDYDNDGDLDLALAGETVTSVRISRVYRNEGGVFTDVGAGLTGVCQGAVAWGDFDLDGDLDLAMTGRAIGLAGTSRIYRNDGAGTLTDISAGLPGLFLSSAAWGDYDADGDLDLALAGHDGSALLSRVYRNDGGAFADVGAELPGVYVCSLAWGDYDADGDLDLALTGYTGSAMLTRVYRNDGSGVFTDVSAALPGVWCGAAAWGDCDNDGDLDVLMTGAMGVSSGVPINPVSRIYRSIDIPSNAPPAAPTDLSVRVSGDEVTLNWTPATDAQTPAAGLSYDLRIGTTPGGSEIRAAMADPANGYRRVAQPGHAQQRTSWRLTLPPGSGPWYWSVQAVDAGFAGSPFALEQSFDPTTDVAGGLPNELSFALAGANPVTGEARFRLALPSTARVELSIHDVMGRRVGTLANREMEAGHHIMSWGAGEGRSANAGIYFARLAVEDRVLTQRFVLLR